MEWWIHKETVMMVVVVVMAFTSHTRILIKGKIVKSIPAWPFFPLLFKVEISLCTPVPLFRPRSVHSGSASWDNKGQVFPDKLTISSFPWYVPALCMDNTVSPLWLCCIKSVCIFRCNLQIVRLAEWPGPFPYHCSNVELEWTQNKSQHKS